MERRRRDGFPLYDREELIADGVIHLAGLCFALVGGAALAALAADHAGNPASFAAVLAYVVALTAMFGFSAAYNLCPVCRTKAVLRRCDHAAIYLLIAGTCTPFLAHAADGRTVVALLGIWAVAGLGIVAKLVLPRRLDRISVAFYVLLGWGGILLLRSLGSEATATTFRLVCAGGILISLGVIFHAWRHLRFHNAIWHGFVLIGTACHYAAVLDHAGLARP